jgi:hypothetical protein
MILLVPRKIFLGIRINAELKKLLEEIGEAEERSVSQICELLLRRGAATYKKAGPKYLQSLPSSQRKESPE